MVVVVILPTVAIVIPPVLDGQVVFPIAWKRRHARAAASLGDPVAVIGLRPAGHGEHRHQQGHHAARRPQSQPPGAAPGGRRRCRGRVRSSSVDSPIHGSLPVDGTPASIPGGAVEGRLSNPRASSSGRPRPSSLPWRDPSERVSRWPGPPLPCGSRQERGRSDRGTDRTGGSRSAHRRFRRFGLGGPGRRSSLEEEHLAHTGRRPGL